MARRSNPTGNSSRTSTGAYKKLRKAAKERDDYRCVLCGRGPEDGVELEVDHTVRWTDGGADDLDNLVTLCIDHHKAKTIAENSGPKQYIPVSSVDWL